MTRPINVTWLTMNPNLGASARTLQDWILLGRPDTLRATIALRTDGDLATLAGCRGNPAQAEPDAVADRANALRSLIHAWTMQRWMKRHHAQ